MSAGTSAASYSAADSSVWKPSRKTKADKHLDELRCRNEYACYGIQNVYSLGKTLGKVQEEQEDVDNCTQGCTYRVHNSYISSLEMTLRKNK